MRDQINAGASAEYHFAAELLSRGFVPNWPSIEAGQYDMIADTGTRFHRIQVKSTVRSTDTIQIHFQTKFKKKKRRYTAKEVDFFAVYVSGVGAWYIFPLNAVGCAVTIKPGNPKCRFNKYLEAWHLLK